MATVNMRDHWPFSTISYDRPALLVARNPGHASIESLARGILSDHGEEPGIQWDAWPSQAL